MMMKRSDAKNENVGSGSCAGSEWNTSVSNGKNGSVDSEKNRRIDNGRHRSVDSRRHMSVNNGKNRNVIGRRSDKNVHGPDGVEADGSNLAPRVTFASPLSLASC